MKEIQDYIILSHRMLDEGDKVNSTKCLSSVLSHLWWYTFEFITWYVLDTQYKTQTKKQHLKYCQLNFHSVINIRKEIKYFFSLIGEKIVLTITRKNPVFCYIIL